MDKLNSFVSTSDLTSLTTNCINKKIGTLDTIDNVIKYDNETNNIYNLSNIVIKLFLPSGIETYSVDNSSYNF